VHGQAVALGFNLDEVGCSDPEDRCEKGVIVPARFKGRMVHHKGKRSAKYATALAFVTAAGDLLPPYLAISQKLNQEFRGSGLLMGKQAVVVENRSPHINQQLFADYTNRVFLSFPQKVCTNP
jgi:hypothetical protein